MCNVVVALATLLRGCRLPMDHRTAMVVKYGPFFHCAMVGAILWLGGGGGGCLPISISGVKVREVMVTKHLQYGRAA